MDRAPFSANAVTDDDTHFRDGLGERRLTNVASGPTQELLCVRAELTTVPSFEPALRDRLNELAHFRHPYFASALSIERTTNGDATLAVLSEHVDGIRLSSLFKQAAARGLNLDINASLCLIRQVVPAIARLHESCGDVAHGALGPDRVVLTTTGRLMITEYVFGQALEQLRYSQDRYWRELRVAVPHAAGLPRFDHRTDVTQIGVIALSLILGRMLRDDEYPARLSDVLTTARAIAPKGGFEPLPPALRGWLSRALQLDVRHAFANACEAHEDLERIVTDLEYPGLPASVEAFLTRYHEAEAAVDTKAPIAIVVRDTEPDVAVGPDNDKPPAGGEPATGLPKQWFDDDSSLSDFAPEIELAQARKRPDRARDDAALTAPPVRDLFAQDAPAPRRRWAMFAGVGTALALTAAVPIWGRVVPRPSPAPGTGTLVITTSPPGAFASLDGRPLGVTPLTATVLAGSYTLDVRGEGDARTLPVAMTAGARLEQYIELPAPPVAQEPESLAAIEGASVGGASTLLAAAPAASPAARPAPTEPTVPVEPQLGWLTVRTPIELSVAEDGAPLGTTADRIGLTVGRHVLTLRNDALNFQTTRTVQVSADKAIATTVDVPNGLVSVNASPWAEVWLDGVRVGETPIGNLTVPIGPHELLLRHPELGEQRRRVLVATTGVSRLSVDLRDRPASND